MTRRHDSRYRPPADLYAAHRCVCNHLIYANAAPGDPCLFCTCKDHSPAEAGDVR